MKKVKFDNANLDAVNALVSELNALASRADAELMEIARTNRRLYEILAMVYARYLAAKEDKALMAATVAKIAEHLTARDERIQKNSKSLSVFVRYVFNVERQRVYNYTQAIEAAIADDCLPEQFADYVEKAGGIEQCKKKATPARPAVAEQRRKVDAVKPEVQAQLRDVSTPALAKIKVSREHVANVYGKGFAIMIGTCDSEGNVDVRAVIPEYSAKVEAWAMEALAKQVAKHHDVIHEATLKSDYERAMECAVAAAHVDESLSSMALDLEIA